MQINQHNYETFFLMYVDDELSPQQKDRVEAFVQEHPELARELELLQQTVLGADEAISFAGKENLRHRPGPTEEDLLTYLDGEADAHMAATIEKCMQQDEALRRQISDLKKLYLSDDHPLKYPRKRDLYQRAPVRAMEWWKIAVAASLLVCISAWLFLYKNENDVPITIAQLDTTRDQQEARSVTKTDSVTVQSDEAMTTAPKVSDEPEKKEPAETKEAVVAPAQKPAAPTPVIAKAETVVDRPMVQPISPKETIDPSSSDTKSIVLAVPDVQIAPVTASKTPTALENPSANEKKKSFLKKIGRKISDQALDILSDGGDKIHVAGFAINIDR